MRDRQAGPDLDAFCGPVLGHSRRTYLLFSSQRWEYPGDPLTPGSPSIPGTERLAPDQATDLAKIPSTPISYGEAQPLLEALGGPERPRFQGGLPFRYHVGPGPTEAHLNLDIAYDTERVSDAIAVIRGTKHPDEKVVIGGHSDAWTYGATTT